MNSFSHSVTVTKDGEEIPSLEVRNDSHHSLKAEVDQKNGDIVLSFSSRAALHEFAKALLQEAAFGNGGQLEFFPLISEGNSLVVNGVRMLNHSSRIVVFYPDGDK
jgi:hypothetical protein